MNLDKISNSFSNNIAINWKNKSNYIYKTEGQLKKFLDFLKNTIYDNTNILEVGCGIGKNLIYIDKNYTLNKLVGIDISNDMLRQINYNFKNYTELINTDILNYNSNDKFNFIILKQVFHHLINKKAVIKFLENLLLSNGKIILMFPNEKYNSNNITYEGENDILGRIEYKNFKRYISNTNLNITTYETDYGKFIFKNIKNYINFLYSIGSLQKIYNYDFDDMRYQKYMYYFDKLLDKNFEVNMEVSYSYIVLEKRD